VRLRLEQLEDRTLPSNFFALTVSDLIADINAANKAGGSNTITLTAPTSSPYVLTAVDNTSDGPTGLPVIAHKDSLTIIGNGDTIERSAASGTPAFRLFDVASSAALTLNNLTLQNGLAFGSGSSADGGAVYSQGNLTLSGATAQNNEALGSSGAAGTSYQVNGQPGADAAGGGVWSNGSLTLQGNTTLENNLAVGGNGGAASCNKKGGGTGGSGGNGYGGGLYVAGGTANISNTSLSHSTAQGGLGGSAGCSSAAGRNGDGTAGGLDVAAANVTMSNATVEYNAADFAAGIYIQYATKWSGQGVLTITGSTVSSNSATINGGGIYNVGTLTVSNSTVSSNSAGGYGGGIANNTNATLTVSGTTVSGNSASYDGAGIHDTGISMLLSNDIIQANTGSGVNMIVGVGSTATFCNDTVENNTGTGIEGAASQVYIDQFTVDHTINNGGGINIFPGSGYTLQNC
jgi:hypothetical protein